MYEYIKNESGGIFFVLASYMAHGPLPVKYHILFSFFNQNFTIIVAQ